MDIVLVVVVWAVVTAALWLTAAVRGNVDWRIAAIGLTYGAVIAAALGAIVATGTLVVYRADEPPVVVAMLAAGGTIGLGFFGLGVTLMPIGFMARGGQDWARYGAWVAVAVIAVSLGFGWTSYMAFQERPSAPQSSPAATP